MLAAWNAAKGLSVAQGQLSLRGSRQQRSRNSFVDQTSFLKGLIDFRSCCGSAEECAP